MLPLDDSALYDLPEAGRRLFADPARLRRLARRRRIPATPGGQGLPRAWVDAEAGTAPADADALAAYWLERLAPPDPEASRPARDRRGLPVETLLAPEEAARRLHADAAFLRRLDAEGVVPSLLVDGVSRYDAILVDLVADEDLDAPLRARADARRAEVLAWARHAWVTGLDEGRAPPAPPAKAAPRPAVDAAPHAWRMPEDLARPESAPREDLIEAEGFETVEED